ncbi:hypothetical protein BGZ60DRAFT_41638 [Tricladium varicosporioides]|nr:hypothetical protein BGZ60DRAFT_41638 [Hymenoscyphus varicosporioides]
MRMYLLVMGLRAIEGDEMLFCVEKQFHGRGGVAEKYSRLNRDVEAAGTRCVGDSPSSFLTHPKLHYPREVRTHLIAKENTDHFRWTARSIMIFLKCDRSLMEEAVKSLGLSNPGALYPYMISWQEIYLQYRVDDDNLWRSSSNSSSHIH